MNRYKKRKILTIIGLSLSSLLFAWAAALFVNVEIIVGEEWWDSCQALEDPQLVLDCKDFRGIYSWETRDKYIERSQVGSAQRNFALFTGFLFLLLFIIISVSIYEYLTRKNIFSKH